MEHEKELTSQLSRQYPAHSELFSLLVPLSLSGHIPPFVYVTDERNQRLAVDAITSTLTRAAEIHRKRASNKEALRFACIDAMQCLTSRLFFDTALNALAKFEPDWNKGSSYWGGAQGARWNESVGGFAQGLQAVLADIARENGEDSAEGDKCSLVLVVENADRLEGNVPELVVPLTRLAELVRGLLPFLCYDHAYRQFHRR